jgi:hypothetical protein
LADRRAVTRPAHLAEPQVQPEPRRSPLVTRRQHYPAQVRRAGFAGAEKSMTAKRLSLLLPATATTAIATPRSASTTGTPRRAPSTLETCLQHATGYGRGPPIATELFTQRQDVTDKPGRSLTVVRSVPGAASSIRSSSLPSPARGHLSRQHLPAVHPHHAMLAERSRAVSADPHSA